jgi:hypothetical protein
VGVRFSAPFQTSPGAHPASCTMGTGSFPGVESGQDVTLTPHPLLVRSSKNRVALYLYSPQGPSCPVKRAKPTYLLDFVHYLMSTTTHCVSMMPCTSSRRSNPVSQSRNQQCSIKNWLSNVDCQTDHQCHIMNVSCSPCKRTQPIM